MSHQVPQSVRVNELQIGNHLFDFQLDGSYFATIEGCELLGGEVSVEACVDVRDRDYTIAISCRGVVQVTCDRCLEPMDLPIETLDEDVEVEDGVEEIDLCWLAYEMIVVSLPLVHSHQAGGCNPEMDALLQSHLCHQRDEDTI